MESVTVVSDSFFISLAHPDIHTIHSQENNSCREEENSDGNLSKSIEIVMNRSVHVSTSTSGVLKEIMRVMKIWL